MTDASENVFDGDWFDKTSAFPSGDGRAGGAFRFGVNVLPGDVDGNNVVGIGDYLALVGQLGLSGDGLATDFNGDGRVDLIDFAITRGGFGDTLPAFAPESPMSALQAIVEPIVATAAPVAPVVSQPLDVVYENDASADLTVAAALAPAVDLLVESLSAGSYIPEAQAISPVRAQLAATAEYDLRSLGDDPPAGEGDDLLALSLSNGLADILAESVLARLR